MKQFIKVFVIVLTVTALPIILFAGIALADANTRATGFTDMAPVFDAKIQADNALTLSAFGYSFEIGGEFYNFSQSVLETIGQAVPHSIKTASEIIKKIADLILRAAFQAH